MLEARYAVPMIGAALVSINIRLSAKEVAYIINHKAVFVDNEFAGTMEPILPQLEKVKLFVNICDAGHAQPFDGPEYEAFLATGANPVAANEPFTEEEVTLWLSKPLRPSVTANCRRWTKRRPMQ